MANTCSTNARNYQLLYGRQFTTDTGRLFFRRRANQLPLAFHKHANSEVQIAFFAAVNHLNGPLRKQNFALTGSKGQGL